MTRDPSAGFWRLLGRGFARRCPRCGAQDVFASWGRMKEWCPGCGLGFEREPGYWVGAMIINTAVTFALFLAVFVGGWILLWPDVPWFGLMAVTAAMAVAVPILFYPRSKTVWLGVEMSYHGLEPPEREAAARRLDGSPPGG